VTGPLSPAQRTAIERYPELAGLLHLTRAGGWQVSLLPGERFLALRVHPDGHTDSLVIFGQSNAATQRLNPHGELVWQRSGTTADAVNHLLDLPAPGARGAPYLVIGRGATGSALWTP
jgi:hypothetical protein